MEQTTPIEPTPSELNKTPYHQESFWNQYKSLFKGLFIGFLILLMLIPSFFVENLVHERALRKNEVIAEVSQKWGNAQTVYGPTIVIPYLKTVTESDNKTKQVKDFIYYMPDSLHISSILHPEIRRRSLYEVSLYKTNVQIQGAYKPRNFTMTGIPPQNILWKEAYLQIGITDVKGLEKQVTVVWDKTTKGECSVNNGSDSTNNADARSELTFPISLDASKAQTFSMEIDLKGSEQLYFTPAGSQTQVDMHSSWQSPAFDGNYLPTNNPVVDKNGYTANWNIPQASRPYSQITVGHIPDLKSSVFGVKLLQPNDSYSKNERSVKYSLLFITLTFAFFFLMEIVQKKQIHPLQYILVGFALILFYVLLLSISEYQGFNAAYFIAATATISLIGFYVGAILNAPRAGLFFGFGLTGLYGYIFFLIQLEDYALLFGSIGLFVILALIMYQTRKINWYQMKTKQKNEAE